MTYNFNLEKIFIRKCNEIIFSTTMLAQHEHHRPQ